MFLRPFSFSIALGLASFVFGSPKTQTNWIWTPQRRLAEDLPPEDKAVCRGNAQAINKFCYDWTDYWMSWEGTADPNSYNQDSCVVDSVTKTMHCSLKAQCSGGYMAESDLSFLSYPCGKNCEGSLLIDCCLKCGTYRDDPRSLGVNGVACQGCEDEDIAKATEQAQCFFNGKSFKCQSSDHCHLGSPSRFEKSCNIIPCDHCETENLKGQCCQDCVRRQCVDKNLTSNLVCKGCNEVTSSSSVPTWAWVLIILVTTALVVYLVYRAYVSRKGSESGEESSEEQD